LEMRPHVVHACMPWAGGMWVYAFPGVGNAYEMQALYEKACTEGADLELRQQLNNLAGEAEVDHETVIAVPAQGLLQVAERTHASLIVCEAHHSSYRLMPRSVSTIVTLLAGTKIPLLIMPHDKNDDFQKGHLRIAVCDDLRSSSRHALAIASELGCAGTGNQIQQIHCSDLNPVDFESFSRSYAYVNRDRLELTEALPTFQELLTTTELKIAEHMQDRMAPFKPLLERNKCALEKVVLFGDVEDELSKYLRRSDADVIVFGKHQMFHENILHLGSLSLTSMLQFHKPVLIVP
jgi:nucleotide-binding universal stress UspA family protein